MKILVLNCGSSSIKYQLINTETKQEMAVGIVERIGASDAFLKHKAFDKEKIQIDGEVLNHSTAIEYVIAVLLHPNYGVLKNIKEIDAVGHRVVHGAETFSGSVRITDEVIKALKDNIELAPLHNPPNIAGIEAVSEHLPDVIQCGVFDTAFHMTMPPHAYLYGIPYKLYEKYKIRRYGFHGTSHRYVSERAAALMKKPITELKIITAHLGNGASMAAILNGKSIDTTMGMTPLEGLLMGTRCGDLDPNLPLFIMEKEDLNLKEMATLLNKHSGVVGLAGLTNDMRDIEKAVEEGHERATVTLDAYNYKIKKYIGAYAAALGGVDALVFTGGVGENSPLTRRESCSGLEFMGIKLDPKKNENAKGECDISTSDSKVKVFKIPTNEELVIALDTEEIVNSVIKKKK
ncbi:MAG: acetate kinase [Ignavibacteriales bacterium]|nr:acetate kinase [Ignavibacteriales bacterium]